MAINKVIYNNSTLIDITGTTATASDVASGKIFFTADGVQTTGTASSGSSSWTLVDSTSYTVSTTSTSASTVATWSTGDSSLWDDSVIVYVRIRDSAGARAGYFYGSDNFFQNYSTSGTSTANGSIRNIWRYTSDSAWGWRYGYSTTGYGVYADYLYSNGRIRIRRRYNSTYSLTIDGTYTVEAYILQYPDGVGPFA